MRQRRPRRSRYGCLPILSSGLRTATKVLHVARTRHLVASW
jgi:hypothetical protein